MSLLALPDEALLSIAKALGLDWDTSALSQVNRRLYALFDRVVYHQCSAHIFIVQFPVQSSDRWQIMEGKASKEGPG